MLKQQILGIQHRKFQSLTLLRCCVIGMKKWIGERRVFMGKKKNVTIPEELFIDLVKYFLADIRCDEDRIRLGLQEKMEAMVNCIPDMSNSAKQTKLRIRPCPKS